jgi:hypothetical protein
MDLLQDLVDRSVIALWLGHESVETTQMYLHADMRMTEKARSRTLSHWASNRRDSALMTSCWPSWKAYDYADSGGHASPSQPLTPLSIRHNQEVGIFLVMPRAALQGKYFDCSQE